MIEFHKNWLHRSYLVIKDKYKKIDSLDQQIGDGDHGVTMSIGWTAVKEKLNDINPEDGFQKICTQIASSFLSAVGASAGPLYATALMRGGAALKDLSEANAKQIAEFFFAAANAASASRTISSSEL